MKKYNLFFIAFTILCILSASCSADLPIEKSAPALPNAFTADIEVYYNENKYTGLLNFGEGSVSIIFSSPDGLDGIKAEYLPDGLRVEYKDTQSIPNANAISEVGPLMTVLKKISSAFRTASETQITDTYYIYQNSSGVLYFNIKSGAPEYIEADGLKITFGNFKTVQ